MKKIYSLLLLVGILWGSVSSAFAAKAPPTPVVYPDSMYCSEVVAIAKWTSSISKLKSAYIANTFWKFSATKYGFWTVDSAVFHMYSNYNEYNPNSNWNVKAYLDYSFTEIQSNLDTCKGIAGTSKNTKMVNALKNVQTTITTEKAKMVKAYSEIQSKTPAIIKFYNAERVRLWNKVDLNQSQKSTWKKFSKSGSWVYEKSWNAFLSALIESRDERG